MPLIFNDKIEAASRWIKEFGQAHHNGNESVKDALGGVQGLLEELRRAEEELLKKNMFLFDLRRELAAERRRARGFFDSIPEACLTTDRRGVINDFNRHAPVLLKTAEGALKGVSILEFLADADERSLLERIGAVATGIEIDAKALLKTGDGVRLMAMLRASPIQDQDGSCTGVFWLIRANESAGAGPDGDAMDKLELLDGVLDNSRAVICVKDISGRYILANRLAEKTLDKESIIGRTPYDIFPGDAASALEANDKKAMDAGVPMEFEEVVEVCGQRRVYLSIRFPIFGPGGITAVCGISTDVTEKKRAEERIMEHCRLLKAVMDNSKAAMDIKDRSGRYLLVNRRFEENIRMPLKEIAGRSPYGLYPKKTAGRLLEHDRKVISAKAPMEFEEDIMLADGLHTFITGKFPIFDSSGDVRAVCGVSSDITGLKQAEEALKEGAERFRRLFEQSADAQFIFRRGAPGIMDANPVAERLFGRSREEFISKGPALFLAGAELSRFEGEISGLRDEVGFSIDRLSCAGKDGARVTVSVRGQTIRLKRRAAVYCAMRDVTDMIRMEEENRSMQARLAQAGKTASVGALASGIAHEIDDPADEIVFNASLLGEVWRDAGKVLQGHYRERGDFSVGALQFSEVMKVVPELLSGITGGARRIKKTVEGLKDLSRSDGGDRGREEFDVNKAVARTVSALSGRIKGYTDNFHVECAVGLPRVRGSALEIEQVVENLVVSALRTLNDRSRGIWVSTAYDRGRGEVEIAVKDEGLGMSKEVLGRVNEPSFIAGAQAGGTGLGLSISRSIVRGHGGTIDFVSEPGMGAVARIRLPAVVKNG